MIGFRNEREAGASLALHSFFFLDNQVVQAFRCKDRLIMSRAVTYEVYGEDMLSRIKASAGKSLASHLLKDGSRLKEGVDVHKLDFRPGSMFV